MVDDAAAGFSKAPGTDLMENIIELSCPVGLALFVAGRGAVLPSANEDKTTLKRQKNE